MRPLGCSRDKRAIWACVAALLTAALRSAEVSSRRFAASRAAWVADKASSRAVAGGQVLALAQAGFLRG
jgi:hypothetical protein